MSHKIFIVKGVSYSQDKLNVFALILEDEHSKVILPIVIGGAEAQAISYAMKNENKLARPITHDIFSEFIKHVGYHIENIEVHKIEDGVFFSNIIFKNSKNESIIIDARTSDAVAMALHFSAPIYVSESVISEAGVVLPAYDLKQNSLKINPTKEGYDVYSTEDLQELLEIAVREEDFDAAIELDKELKKRKS